MTNNKFLNGMTVNHTKKMQGMVSFSTSNLCNKFCDKMKDTKGSICQKCFADRQLKIQKSTANKMERNNWIKYDTLIKENTPFINNAYFRFESFGELETMQQLKNYMNIAKYNKHCNFTLFTKRADLLNRFEGKKPANFLIMLSSPLINKQVIPNEKIESLINGIFTVYDKKTIEEKDIKINCGSLKCIECLACYKKGKKTKIINEMLK